MNANFTLPPFQEDEMEENPVKEFQKWFHLAQKSGELKPDAFVLSTVSSEGHPSSRVLLYKGLLENDFLFFTNYEGQKGMDLHVNPVASILFYWPSLGRQVRIFGTVEKTSEEISQTYFQSRPRGSQISASISPQSSSIPSRAYLQELWNQMEKKYENRPIPCPPNWGGYRLDPLKMEFWVDRPDRLHDRFIYTRKKNDLVQDQEDKIFSWKRERLAP